MPAHKNRFRFGIFFGVFVSTLALVSSCQTPAPAPPAPPDAKAELTKLLQGANVSGFDFSTREDDASAVSAFTNSAVRSLITLDPGTNNLVLQYASVKDKKANSTKTYKTEVVRSDKTLAIQVTDIGTNAVVSKDTFQTQPRPAGEGQFNSLEECLKDFDCKHRGELQCEANRTCKDQFAAITCCLKDGSCFSVHLVIRPNSIRCRLSDVIVNLDGLVLRQ